VTGPSVAGRPETGTVRPATAEDWPRIWPFFRETVLAGETYAYPDDLTSEQARALWLEPPPGLTVVHEVGGAILGSAKMGPNRPARGAHVGTASFMVAPAARGRGVGRTLAEWVIAWHRAEGYRGIQFNAVVETNTAAVRLWQDLGFEIVGTVPGAFRSATHGYVGLHVMYLDLTTRG
jgi:L-amino acid N-acyltransferase YncA